MGKFRLIVFSLILLCFFHPAISQKKKDYLCIQLDRCQCKFPHSGLGINLNGLNVASDNSTSSSVVRFHPCFNIELNSPIIPNVTVINDCVKGTSLCLIQPSILKPNVTNMTNLGEADSFKFQSSIDGTEITLIGQYDSWTTSINLQCERNSEIDRLKIDRINQMTKELYVTLQSPKSCLTNDFDSIRMGTWSVILIVICTIILVYFIGGSFLKSFLFGAQGLEMIPHYSFWNSALSRLTNCFFSCTRGCQPSTGYDRI